VLSQITFSILFVTLDEAHYYFLQCFDNVGWVI